MLFFRQLRRHIFRAAGVAAILSLFVIALKTIQAGGLQTAPAKPADPKNTITYFISDGNAEIGYRPSDRELAQWALAAWQRSAGKGFHLKAVDQSSARIQLYWAAPDAGEYGEMRPFREGGKPGAAVFIRPDMEALGPDIAARAGADPLLRESIVYLTCLHELGHALGLEHTRDFRDVMYFFGYGGDVVQFFDRYRTQLHSRSDIAGLSGLSDADVSRIHALYPSK